MIAKLKRRRLRKTAKAVGEALETQFGKKTFYTDDELATVCSELGLREAQAVNAYGMFAEETACNGLLTKIGSSQTARELRVFLAGQMFGGVYVVSYDSLSNKFHDYEDQLGPPPSSGGSGGSWFGGGGDDGDYDSGDISGGDGDF